MVNLCVVAGYAVNGVAEIHSEIVKYEVFNEFYKVTIQTGETFTLPFNAFWQSEALILFEDLLYTYLLIFGSCGLKNFKIKQMGYTKKSGFTFAIQIWAKL